MSIGAVRLIVLGFPVSRFHGAITAEPECLCESDIVRVVDALAVHKDAAAASRWLTSATWPRKRRSSSGVSSGR